MSSSKMIVLKSSDGEAFEVEEAVAFVSRRIKYMIEDECFDCSLPGVFMLRIGDVTSKILSMVLEYCKKHVDTPADDLKSFDSDFVKVDQGTLFDLILAATSLDIMSLLDVAYQAVGNMIKGKTTEEIRMTFNIKNDFTPEEELEMSMEPISYVPRFEFGQKQDSLHDLETSKRMRMSEYIVSFSHQKEIMIRLPVATVLECRRVSKGWKSLIESPAFITAHSHYRYTHPRCLLVSSSPPHSDDDLDESDSDDEYAYKVFYFSFVDDNTFLRRQLACTQIARMPINELFGIVVVGSSNGLTCLSGYAPKLGKLVAIIWNPIIGKKVIVPFAKATADSDIGFGVCPVTGDIKLVTVNFDDDFAKVFTLSTRKWRGIPMLPHAKSWSPKTTDKFLHSCTDGCVKKLVSFDLTMETWKATDLPNTVTSFRYTCKIRDSFAMVVPTSGKGFEYSVWTLENDQTSFTKLYNITCQSTLDAILASRANGRLIMLRACPGFVGVCPPVGSGPPRIVEYDPKSGVDYALSIDDPLLIDDPFSFDDPFLIGGFFWYGTKVQPYEQTLLLLDCHETQIEYDPELGLD